MTAYPHAFPAAFSQFVRGSYSARTVPPGGRSDLPPNRSMPDVSVVPVLVYDDVAEARDWLCRVVGFVKRFDMRPPIT